MSDAAPPLAVVPLKADDANRRELLAMLDVVRQQVESGEVISIGMVTVKVGNLWVTEFSSSSDRARDAGMLMALAMRRLGFDNPL